jgi:hypothetical protein
MLFAIVIVAFSYIQWWVQWEYGGIIQQSWPNGGLYVSVVRDRVSLTIALHPTVVQYSHE